MLSQTADHAVRALIALARHGAARPMRVEELADRTGAPRNYLGKTLNVLVKEGLLRSARGPTGGFALAVPADAITIGRIDAIFGEARPSPRCLLGNGPCDPSAPCAAHDRWMEMTSAARRPLDRTSIGQLLPPDPDPMTDAIAGDWSVNRTLLAHPATAAVFNRFGIDSCCGGAVTLLEAARDAGIPAGPLLEALAAAARPSVEAA